MGIMEKKMETTITGYIGIIRYIYIYIYWGYIGVMKKNMGTSIMGYIVFWV